MFAIIFKIPLERKWRFSEWQTKIAFQLIPKQQLAIIPSRIHVSAVDLFIQVCIYAIGNVLLLLFIFGFVITSISYIRFELYVRFLPFHGLIVISLYSPTVAPEILGIAQA